MTPDEFFDWIVNAVESAQAEYGGSVPAIYQVMAPRWTGRGVCAFDFDDGTSFVVIADADQVPLPKRPP